MTKETDRLYPSFHRKTILEEGVMRWDCITTELQPGVGAWRPGHRLPETTLMFSLTYLFCGTNGNSRKKLNADFS